MNLIPKLIEINEIEKLYKKGYSASEIGNSLGISWRKVIYLMQKHNIRRRTRSEATYRKLNPDGDPFKIKKALTKYEEELKVLALGLYLGEGAKNNYLSVRLSNSDANLVNIFLNFLKQICGVRSQKIKLWLTLHSDVSDREAQQYWSQELNLPLSQFSKSVIINHSDNGKYRNKSRYGTATICAHNVKLRKILQGWVNKFVRKHAYIAHALELKV